MSQGATVENSPRVRRVGGMWLQVAEAARRLGVTRGRVYHLIWDERLCAKEIEGLLYVREADVHQYKSLRRESARVGGVMVPNTFKRGRWRRGRI